MGFEATCLSDYGASCDNLPQYTEICLVNSDQTNTESCSCVYFKERNVGKKQGRRGGMKEEGGSES